MVIGHLKEKRGCLQDQLVKSSKAKVRILNPAAAAAATLAASAEGPGQGQGQGQRRGVQEARLQYSVLLQLTRPGGRYREQSLLHVQLDTGEWAVGGEKEKRRGGRRQGWEKKKKASEAWLIAI